MEEDDARTLYCGSVPEKATENLLYELFLQAGPLESVYIPKEKNGRNKPYAFIKFKHEASVPYTIALMQGISLFGKELELKFKNNAQSRNSHNPYVNVINAHKRKCSDVPFENNFSSYSPHYGKNGYRGSSGPNFEAGRGPPNYRYMDHTPPSRSYPDDIARQINFMPTPEYGFANMNGQLNSDIQYRNLQQQFGRTAAYSLTPPGMTSYRNDKAGMLGARPANHRLNNYRH